MKKDVTNWGGENVHVLYDKPHYRFQRLDSPARTEFMDRLESEIPVLKRVKKDGGKFFAYKMFGA